MRINPKRYFKNYLAMACVTFALGGGASSIASCKQSSGFSGGAKRENPKKSNETVLKKEVVASPTPSLTPIPRPTHLPTPMPTPVIPNAIVKGSFTVWANPPNPKADQDYDIHIRIKLPANTVVYTKEDLSGTLTGTDGYDQTINDPYESEQRFSFIPGSGYAEFVMPIPGTYQGVDDTLNVTSKLISETQKIVVHFN